MWRREIFCPQRISRDGVGVKNAANALPEALAGDGQMWFQETFMFPVGMWSWMPHKFV